MELWVLCVVGGAQIVAPGVENRHVCIDGSEYEGVSSGQQVMSCLSFQDQLGHEQSYIICVQCRSPYLRSNKDKTSSPCSSTTASFPPPKHHPIHLNNNHPQTPP